MFGRVVLAETVSAYDITMCPPSVGLSAAVCNVAYVLGVGRIRYKNVLYCIVCLQELVV